ncbi:hypothetical protein I5523_08395 [Acinetobacter oleivorans]|uniref:hypothetical protein n=1 Tax=Acinetobacter oleivorans TaxID=1148157 RepID=UPI001900524E|nr:hypothetical protein [Acinetobacter oleivorans]MBJ9739661.1 hypothetical protein [Acinetobacter oleivorans]MCU4409661.1 hypothetical protein [Acinetobacter oleivorans]
MEQFLKRISFFLLYLPALVYSCQFAYYAGLCEPLAIQISSLSLNYPEVMLLGYLNIALLLLHTLSLLAIAILILIIILFLSISSYWYLKHKNIEYNKYLNRCIRISKCKILRSKIEIVNFLNSCGGISVFYTVMLIFSLGIILYYYNQGTKEIEARVKEIISSKNYSKDVGYITRNNKKITTYSILCGNNKCYGVDIDKKEAITYLPEEYAKPIDTSKFKNKTS